MIIGLDIGYYRPQDAARALKKLITNNVGKSNIAIMYALTVSIVLFYYYMPFFSIDFMSAVSL